MTRAQLLTLITLTPALAVGAAHTPHARSHVRLPPVEELFKVNDAPVSPRAKIFLVAGSGETAAFAQEIVDQRHLWLTAGFHEDEIECYFPVPYQEDAMLDPKHFLALAPELAPCHRVSVATLRAHLQTVAEQKPPFVYLYVTSHGGDPVSEKLKLARESDKDYWALRRESRYPVFDQYQVVVEGLAGDTALDQELLGALRAGVSPDELYLTPPNLQKMLGAFAEVPKFVVIQACHSGGFIEDPSPRLADGLLSRLPAITVLTAARHDRSSFGCEPGGSRTFYGEVFSEALAKVAADPRTIDWKQLSDEVAKRVAALEKKRKVAPPSMPQFFSHPGTR